MFYMNVCQTSQLLSNTTTDFYMKSVFTKRKFRTHYNIEKLYELLKPIEINV